MIYKIAFRYAFSPKNRHKLTSIRIAIGLIFASLALNVILAFMIGLQDKRFSLIREYSSYDAIIEINDNLNVEELLEKLNNDPDIKFAFEFIEVPTIISDDSSQLFGKIRGFKQSDFKELSYSLIKGDFSSSGVILGFSKTLTSSFDYLKPVDVTILKKGKAVTVVPLQIEQTVEGIYYTPISDFNNYYAFMDYNILKQFAPYTQSQIGVFGNVDKIRAIATPYGTVSSWIDQNESLYAAMKLEQYLMYFTLSLMSLIVLFQLYNSTLNLIKTKSGEIAMLRALGITKRQTQQIFSLSSLIVSLTGIIFGTLISYFALNYSNSIMSFLNQITNYRIPILNVSVNLSFSLKNASLVAIPLILITYLMSKLAIKKLLKTNNMEILLNE